ncbi:hypothetical protein AD998_18240 [bacterium 336/3]|nr:hypothetical protein AD998_18240 [bacterium 336/3]
MTTQNETYIGDKNTFAIRYAPGYTYKDNGYYYAFCHLVLGGQIIGDPEEPCFLSSWKSSLKHIKDQIKNNFDSISHTEFSNKTDEELFELVWKSNQLEEQHKDKYKHLPVLDNKVWVNCHISIDETTDAYLITIIELDGKIKFLWKGWREPCPADKIGKLFSVIVDRNFVIDTIESCLDKIEKEYLTYPKQ